MDFFVMFDFIFQVAKWIIPPILLISLLKTPWFKGVMGEYMVNMVIRLKLDKQHYHLVKNVTLPTENGTTQIDHVIVSIYGLFVLETKNMKGWIFGSPNQKTWTQKIYRCSNKFQNPLHQNYKHTCTLQSLLGLNAEQIFSIIVFIGDAVFKTPMPDNVTQGNGFIRYIKAQTTPVLSHEQVREVITKIEDGRLERSFKTNRDHVAHVKSIIDEKTVMPSKTTLPLDTVTPSCPKCGGSMVSRVGKKGEKAGNTFWGCSRYPACRGIVALD
ncbi:NERD domain-containing protein [Aeromonas veronii]|uniref:nuclease-related domain-containing protein n=1 Tax=Aeromonas veronii TaxID=654 RepID=UPI003D1C0881